MSFSIPPSAASPALYQEREAPDREGRRGEERGGGDDANLKAKHDAPASERSISGSGDDAA